MNRSAGQLCIVFQALAGCRIKEGTLTVFQVSHLAVCLILWVRNGTCTVLKFTFSHISVLPFRDHASSILGRVERIGRYLKQLSTTGSGTRTKRLASMLPNAWKHRLPSKRLAPLPMHHKYCHT